MPGKKTIPAAVCLFVLACGSGLTGPSVPLKQLEGAPESVEIGDREFRLETFLWRDFFPLCPPDGRPLIAATHVIASGEERFPPWLNADYVWVINGEEFWEKALVDEKVPAQPNELTRIARDGPMWKPLIYVDVVVRLVDVKGNTYLLRAPDQKVHLTQ